MLEIPEEMKITMKITCTLCQNENVKPDDDCDSDEQHIDLKITKMPMVRLVLCSTCQYKLSDWIYKPLERLHNRINTVEKSIQEHSRGVQSVYDEFTVLKNEIRLLRNKLNVDYVANLLSVIEQVQPNHVNLQIQEAVKQLNNSKAGKALEMINEIRVIVSELNDKLHY